MAKKIRNDSNPASLVSCLVICILCLAQSTNTAAAATQITQFGITWSFDKSISVDGATGTYRYGQYVNGDYWVVGPVKIVSISPASYTENNSPIKYRGGDTTGYKSGHVKNGSMINPVPSSSTIYGARLVSNQGYNSNSYAWNASYNVAYGVSAGNPLVIAVGGSEPDIKSLVSTISLDWWETDGGWPTTRAVAILTVVKTAPSSNAFRPPYCGNQYFNEITTDDIQQGVLADLDPVPGSYGINESFLGGRSVLRHLERPWILHGENTSDNVLPTESMPYYGREQGRVINAAALILNIKCSESEQADKNTLLIRFLQHAIDVAGVKACPEAQNPWLNNGGIHQGKVLPTVFAAKILRYDPNDDKNFSNVVRKQHLKSGQYREQNGYSRGANNLPPDYTHYGNEHDQYYYVTAADVAISNSSSWNPDSRVEKIPYTAADIGLPEYGVRATTDPTTINKYWNAAYRSVSSCIQPNAALVAHIMGLKDIWNNPAFFDYCDRYMAILRNDSNYASWQIGTNGIDQSTSKKFVWNMWDTYRVNYGNVWTAPADQSRPPNADAGPDQTLTASSGSGSASVTLDGSRSSSPNGSIRDPNYIWTERGSQIAAGANPTVILPIGQHTITLRVTDSIGLADTDTVVITVEGLTADTKPPAIISVTASESSVEIQFSEPLDEASASFAGNYGLSDSLKINSVWPELGHNRVILYTDMQTDGKTYTLNVVSVKDAAGNPMAQTSVTYTYDSGLAGYYLFSDAGNSYILDSSGHNNTGYYKNGAHRTDQQEAILGGGNDAVQIPTADCNAVHGTVALWMNEASLSGTQYIFGHSTGSSSNLIQLYTDNGYLCVGMGNDHLLKTEIQLISPQIWYHIALSWDGANYTIYVNGSLGATGAYTGLTLLNNVADIGNTGNTASRTEGFQGLIDEVRIYNRALTAAEISNLALVFLPIGDKIVAEGNELSFTIRTRPDVTMTLADGNLPSLPSFTSNTFRWTPSYSNAGTYQVEFTAPHNTSTDVEFEFTDPHDISIDFEKVAITVTDKSLPDNNSPPIGYWKFDETSGDIASDSSANGNTGYLKNGLTWGTGKMNGAVVFSVPNDAIEITTTNFNLQQGTIAMWVYVQRQTLSRHYFFGHITGTTNRIQLYDKYGYLCLGLGDSQETSVNIQRLQNKKWYHIVLTWNKPTYNVYVNGVLKAGGTYSGLTVLADHADIGNNGFGRNMGLNGKIDDVQIYNRVLNTDEIIRLDVGY